MKNSGYQNSNQIKPSSKVVAIALLVIGIGSTTACGVGVPTGKTSMSLSDGIPTSVSTPMETTDVELGSGIISSGKVTTDKFGNYVSVTLSDDSPLMIFDKSKYDEKSLETFSEEELLKAQQVGSIFLIEQGIDSNLLFDYSPERAKDWLEAHRGEIDPESYEDFSENILNRKDGFKPSLIDTAAGIGTVNIEGNVEDGEWFRGIPDNDGGVRYSELNANLTSAWYLEEDGGTLVFEYEVQGESPVLLPEEVREAHPEDHVSSIDHRITYGLSQAKDGQWLLSGYDTNLKNHLKEAE